MAIQLAPERVNECDKATRYLHAACAYAMENGKLTCGGQVVTAICSVFGSVKGQRLTGRAASREHQWLRAACDAHGTVMDKNVDLTAKQFYTNLDSIYTGNPELPPLLVETSPDISSEQGRQYGEMKLDTADLAKPKKVLKQFAAYKGQRIKVQDMKAIYAGLGMH